MHTTTQVWDNFQDQIVFLYRRAFRSKFEERWSDKRTFFEGYFYNKNDYIELN